MRKYAVIVAGGSGARMGGGIPKQFRNLCGRPVLWWSLKAFHEEDPHTSIILVLPEQFISLWKDFYDTLPESEKIPFSIAAGGKTRGESVKNGLALIPDPDSLVAIHDGARPLVTPALISRGWAAAQEHGAAIPVMDVTDSLRKRTPNGSEAVDRNEFAAVQTPQVFHTSLIKEAYNLVGDQSFTDDAAVAEYAGHTVKLFEGFHKNMKLTHPEDMAVAALLLKEDNGVF